MPRWIEDRAKHIQKKNPDMDESAAWAIATQQAHKLGKTPKNYGTAEGKRAAKEKYGKPKSEYRKTAQWLRKWAALALPKGLLSNPLMLPVTGFKNTARTGVTGATGLGQLGQQGRVGTGNPLANNRPNASQLRRRLLRQSVQRG